MDAPEQREGYEQWQELAPRWERGRELLWASTRAVSEWLVDRLDPQPGQTILDVAAGTGETGFLAAERLGDAGQLISSDLSPNMLEARPGSRCSSASRTPSSGCSTPSGSIYPTRASTACSPASATSSRAIRRPRCASSGACSGPEAGSPSRSGGSARGTRG